MAIQKFLIFSIFIFLGFRAQSQETSPDVIGSGDGLTETSTYSLVPLIDDDGDIATGVAKTDVGNSQNGTEDNSTNTPTPDVMDSPDNKTSPESTFAGTSTLPISGAAMDVTPSQTPQTVVPTIEPLISDLPKINSGTEDAIETTKTVTPAISSTSEITTDADVVTTEDSSKTDVPTSTEAIKFTTKETTTTVSTTTVAFKAKLKDASVQDPPALIPASTLPIFKNAEKRCLFQDAGLLCNGEIICYGEGEIDCTEDEEMEFTETDFNDHLSSDSEELDYIDDEKTSEIAPVKTITSKHRQVIYIPELVLNQKTTPGDLEVNSTVPTGEELLTQDVSQDGVNVTPEDGVHHTADAEPGKLSTLSSFTESSTATDEILPNVSFIDVQEKNDSVPTTTLRFDLDDTEPTNVTESVTEDGMIYHETTTLTLPPNDDVNTSLVFEDVSIANRDEPVILRAKREKSANASDGYHISNYKVSELDSSKKTVKTCKLIGNLFCTPHPNQSMCFGKTFCQAVPHQASETREKPATPTAIENWTIVVIAVCVTIAAFTISMLLYLIITSYKKSKVQPHDDVTTLNYVNSAQP